MLRVVRGFAQAHRGRVARTQLDAENDAARTVQAQWRSHRQREFFRSRLSVEEEVRHRFRQIDLISTRPVTRVWLGQAGATQIQAMWRARQQRLFFASRESVERGENFPPSKRTCTTTNI